jgi:Tfp pilus assembly protein PilO
MLLQSIKKIKPPAWLSVSDKKLRTAALVFAGLVLAHLLVYFVLIVPSSARLSAGERKYAELRKRHTEAVLFKKEKTLFTGIMAGVPAQKDMPILVKELVQTTRRLNLKVEKINYDIPKSVSGELAMLSFSFPIEGWYADVKRFIYDVETSDRFVGIQELKLESAEKGRVKMNMKLVTYVKGQ